ncbi:hypothetical protein [Pandoraea sp. ISTKB]|uniref:hypothetical protein n=1 Tax=Pandoraea sp. ISTKB TaxID=1586708 RepID=UPI000847B5C9|nr:hypothetical protein [Pandoraea sp. ISTKB]ODP35369.1 hypothetical protein A9762_10405 [Pandoraea sp. ISTKB]
MRRLSRIFLSLFALWTALNALPALAISGADVAYLINQRYQKTPSKCLVASPVQECSGVLMRPAPTPGGDLFALSADETANGIARLDFVRRDIETTHLSDSIGFILAPRPEAAGSGKPYTLVCGCPPPGATNPSPCNDCPGQPNTAGVSLWDPAAPGKLAAQAIYYDVGNGGQLATALEYQRQYFDKSGEWMPILRVAFGAKGATVFGFDARDQLDVGYATVNDLNARFADTRRICPDGRAGYFCNGVMIRTTGWGAAFKSWNPSPDSVSKDGVSFSYIRADGDAKSIYWKNNDAGLIMRELGAPTKWPLTLRCIYAQDGATGHATDRCYKAYDVLCNAMNVTTIAAFHAHYKPHSTCAFDVDPVSFQLSIDVRPGIQWVGNELRHNEAIIAPWPQDIPVELPIEAIFYMGEEVAGAQYVQRDYMLTTGRFMPLVHVDLSVTDGKVFTYLPATQSLSLGGEGALTPVSTPPAEQAGQ